MRRPQTDAQMQAEILSWSRSQGLFAGLALEGATLRQDLDDNATLYGKKNRATVSEQRGAAVREYLTQEGMAASSVTAKGFGKTQPVASNDTAKGRQQNRRVELVISGDIIGTEIGTPIAVR